MTDGIVIQARSGSTRLPAKILLPFDGQRRIIDIILENIRRHCPDKKIVLATTDNPADSRIADIASEAGVLCYRGSENDVLSRFIGAAEKFGIDRLIRVCSDNPFLRADSFAQLFSAHDANPQADYVAFAFPDGRPTIKSHLGLYAELTTLDALRRAAAATRQQLYIEHVTIYLYTHPDDFRCCFLPLPDAVSNRTDIRLTLDTQSDFDILRRLYREFSGAPDRSVEALMALIDANPDYGRIMKQNIQQNEK